MQKVEQAHPDEQFTDLAAGVIDRQLATRGSGRVVHANQLSDASSVDGT